MLKAFLGKFTVQRKTSSRSSHQLEPEKMLLQRLMYLLNASYNSDVSNQDIIAALLANPSTPANLREQLWQKHKQEPDDMGRYSKDAKFRMALAYNTAIPKTDRIKYFKQLLQLDSNIQEKIAQNPQTPTEIFLNLMNKKGSGRQAVSKNPNAPYIALEELAKDENKTTRSWVAENPGTPISILIKLVNDGALNNSNFNSLEKHRILIARKNDREIKKAQQTLAKRKHIPYILEDLSQTGIKNNIIFTAINSQTSVPILEQLSKSDNESIRLDELSNIKVYGWYDGGYDNVHEYKIVLATGESKETALQNILLESKLLEIYKFKSFDIFDLLEGCSDKEGEEIKTKYNLLHDFLHKKFSELLVYRFCFWDYEHLYILGEKGDRDLEQICFTDRVGIALSSQFTYNP